MNQTNMNFTSYESNGYFDEMIGEDGKPLLGYGK